MWCRADVISSTTDCLQLLTQDLKPLKAPQAQGALLIEVCSRHVPGVHHVGSEIFGTTKAVLSFSSPRKKNIIH